MKNKLIITFFVLFQYANLFSQDILNPYYDYSIPDPNHPPLHYNPNSGFSFGLSSQVLASQGFTGEYEIFIDNDPIGFSSNYLWGNLLKNRSFTFNIESVSFPFTPECAFTAGGCGSGTSSNDPYYSDRKLFMPSPIYNSVSMQWGDLSLKTYSPGIFTPTPPFSNYSHQTLVTQNYLVDASIGTLVQVWNTVNRTVLPHTILKHTIYVHCDGSIYSSITDSISWYYDNTRGMMRYYPFSPANSKVQYSNATIYDIVFFPNLIHLALCPSATNGNCNGPNNYLTNPNHYYSESHQNYFTNYNTPNNFYYDRINNDCGLGIPSLSDAFGMANANANFSDHIAPNMLLSAPARLNHGEFISGFGFTNYNSPIYKLPGLMHEYFIDKGFPDLDLKWINPHEKVIFNPSDVNVGPKPGNSNLVNLIFPAQYTFKTILGIYPSVQEAEQANTAANGGPYDYLKDVPVPVNASELIPFGANPIDYPDVSSYDDPNTSVVDERYGNYTLNEHSKITVEECVKIFDAIFYVNQGATLQFNNYPSVLNEERFKILWGGGAILKNYAAIQYAQNGVITQEYELKYIALNEIQAGNSVDPDPAAAQIDYTIEPGNTDVKFEAGNTIRLEPGFSAKEGSSFSAKCHPISYPTSLCASPPNTGNRLASALGGGSKAVQALLANSTNSVLRISPNPGTGIFSVQLQNIKEAFSYEVSDVFGRKVLSSKGNSTDNKIDLSEQPKGIYIVSANLDGKQWVEKIIKE